MDNNRVRGGNGRKVRRAGGLGWSEGKDRKLYLDNNKKKERKKMTGFICAVDPGLC